MPTHPSHPTLLDEVGAYTHPPMNSPTTHTTTHQPHEPSSHPTYHHPPHEPSNHPTTTHPMNLPKYMYSDRVTLWICLIGGWVGVHKIKYFNIVTSWVGEYMHPHYEPSNGKVFEHNSITFKNLLVGYEYCF